MENPWGPYRSMIEESVDSCSDYATRLRRSLLHPSDLPKHGGLLRVCGASTTTAKEEAPCRRRILDVSPRYRSQCRPGTGVASEKCQPATGATVSTMNRSRTVGMGNQRGTRSKQTAFSNIHSVDKCSVDQGF